MNEQIKKLMLNLDISEEEAIELINEDKEVDKMKMADIDNDLTEEQKKNIKKAKSAVSENKKSPKSREKKIDAVKAKMITEIADCLKACGYADVEITNVHKYIDFTFDGNHYTVNLIKKNAKKQ